MGYGKYWNFERVMAKAQAWVTQKGYHLGEHFVEFLEKRRALMAQKIKKYYYSL